MGRSGRQRIVHVPWEKIVENLDATDEAVIAQASSLFGKRLRDWQAVAVSRFLKGRDVIIKAGTGSGKSWAYQSMIAAKENGSVLVLAPLKSIMSDQVSCLSCMLITTG